MGDTVVTPPVMSPELASSRVTEAACRPLCIPSTLQEHTCAPQLSRKGLLSQTPGNDLDVANMVKKHRDGTHCILASPGDVPTGVGKPGQGGTPGQADGAELDSGLGATGRGTELQTVSSV